MTNDRGEMMTGTEIESARTSVAHAVQITSDIVKTLAILVGGIWAYIKFARGRTFAYRIELTVAPQLMRSEKGGTFLYVTVTLKNSGLARVPLDRQLKFITTYDTTRVSWNDGRNHEWGKELLLTPVFDDHDFMEPGESISEDVVIPLPAKAKNDPRDAVRIKAEVWALPNRWRREWSNLRHPLRNLKSPLPRRNYSWSAARAIPLSSVTHSKGGTG